jgi:predicted Rossmann-fold nucleotide-binding protein
MSKINAVCVYCGSSPGTDPAFAEAARAFGKILAENGIRLVYGGGSELIVTTNMHDRKWRMFERADGFVALPGGIGTLEELVEQLTWAQLGRHKKPILLANIKGYWDPLLTLVEHMRTQDFLPPVPRVDCLVADRVEDILPKLRDAARDVTDAEKTMAVPVERL